MILNLKLINTETDLIENTEISLSYSPHKTRRVCKLGKAEMSLDSVSQLGISGLGFRVMLSANRVLQIADRGLISPVEWKKRKKCAF